MKRKTYRKEYKNISVNPSKKDEIFSRIMESIGGSSAKRTSVFLRWSHYVRPVASIVSVSLLCVSVFIVAFIADNQPTKIQENIVTTTKTPSIVQASPLGDIITTQGVLGIEKGGKILPIESIQEGVIVFLQEDSKIIFSINDRIQATISGPARFSLESGENGTVLLNLIEGSYAQIESVEHSNSNIEDNKNTGITKNNESGGIELIVKTQKLQVSANTSKTISLVIDESNENQTVITNEGDEILVRNLETQEHLTISQDNEAVWDLSTMVASIGETQVSSVDKKPPLLAIRYETTDENAETLQDVMSNTSIQDGDNDSSLNNEIGVGEDELQALLEDPKEINEKNTDTESEGDEKSENGIAGRVLDEVRMQKLTELVVAGRLGSAVANYQENNENATQELVNLINELLSVFGRSGSSIGTQENLLALTNSLLSILENDYFIPPAIINSIHDMRSEILSVKE